MACRAKSPGSHRRLLVAPAETIRETLRARRLGRRTAADLMGIDHGWLARVLDNTEPVSPDLAQRLYDLTGVPAAFWLALEANYQRDRAAASAS